MPRQRVDPAYFRHECGVGHLFSDIKVRKQQPHAEEKSEHAFAKLPMPNEICSRAESTGLTIKLQDLRWFSRTFLGIREEEDQCTAASQRTACT
jgi:hypothetical protein